MEGAGSLEAAREYGGSSNATIKIRTSSASYQEKCERNSEFGIHEQYEISSSCERFLI